MHHKKYVSHRDKERLKGKASAAAAGQSAALRGEAAGQETPAGRWRQAESGQGRPVFAGPTGQMLTPKASCRARREDRPAAAAEAEPST
ncbi:hypothetical protein [Pantoea coffeiphila]|uniref:Uncharacterized protein n=1 Tax=Pantoea coffeiphila TaxID=1465635 RepID=A0A2S9ICN2_9GAMM|nr:hypothetical protein [Pantoea coffeiphila]PRD15542.1 hypothetical protein CQW29_11085 [Pantoea coffeiphila]